MAKSRWLPLSPWKRTLLIMVLVVAAAVRLYNLAGTLQFQGDQGRDAMIVADIFRKKDFVFIGPVTSVGNLYLGPLYYYFMLPFLWLTYPSPLGPVYAVAGLGIVTVYLVYRLGAKMFGENVGLIGVFFFAFSSTVVQGSRFSWNPNPAPFISILLLYCTWVAWRKNPRFWLWAAVCLSVLFQLHYLTLLALPAVGSIWLLSLREHWQHASLRSIIWPTLLGIGFFLLSIVPLVLFDVRHDGLNAKAFQALLGSSENFAGKGTALEQVGKIIKETEGRGLHIGFEYMIGKNRVLNRTLLYAALVLLFVTLKQKKKDDEDTSAHWVLMSFLLAGIIGTAIYQHTIFDHYIAYLFPMTALLYGLLFTSLRPRAVALVALIIFGGYFLWYNVPRLPLQSLGWTVHDIARTSDEILKRISPGEAYNLVLLSESHDIDAQNYRYFLTTGHTPPVPLQERDSVDTLFIIDEEKKLPKVTDSPIYEIVVFPDKTPTEVFEISGDGPRITVLRRATQPSTNGLE